MQYYGNMRTAQKILLFCPPFQGHFNVLRDLVLASDDRFDWRIIITGWTNIPLDLGSLSKLSTVVATKELHETDPALWTLPRVVSLLNSCLQITADYQPDLIIYDFFSLEGKFVGDHLDIPAWSSIPAFIGTFAHKDYLLNKLASNENVKAMQILRSHYDISLSPNDIEMVSDGLHLPSDMNLVWSYKSVVSANFMSNRHDKPYILIGSSKNLSPITKTLDERAKPTVYISFGTVVMNNLWDQQNELRQNFTSFITKLADTWKDKPWTIIFVTQGKEILTSYPENWVVKTSVDQPEILKKVDLFITHGGSNSFHESLLAGTPMAVIPFFGDQPLVAKSVERLGLGINLVPDATIDTHSSKSFLNDNLVAHLDKSVQKIVKNPAYKERVKATNLSNADVYKTIHGVIDFHEGDLLYGTNCARKKYVDDNSLQNEFGILEFKAFSELAAHDDSLPRIVDIYHDVILDKSHFEKDNRSELSSYIKHLNEYKEYLRGETDFEKMCIKGLISSLKNTKFISY